MRLRRLRLLWSTCESRQSQSLPAAGNNWQEKTLYATGVEDYAVTSKLFMFGDWMVEVYQGIAPVSSTVYQITVFNPELKILLERKYPG